MRGLLGYSSATVARLVESGAGEPEKGESANPMKKLLTVTAVLLMVSASGCFTLNWAHNRRHLRKFIDEIIEFHQDVDKVVFGLDKNPAE
jgi:hypothetical protein